MRRIILAAPSSDMWRRFNALSYGCTN